MDKKSTSKVVPKVFPNIIIHDLMEVICDMFSVVNVYLDHLSSELCVLIVEVCLLW